MVYYEKLSVSSTKDTYICLYSMKKPTFEFENIRQKEGYRFIVGVDEAGCGALAGPVIAGAVVLPINKDLFSELNDSKKLTKKKREELYVLIKNESIAWGVGQATVEEIEQINIRQATYLAMRRAVAKIKSADFVLVDAWEIPELSLAQDNIIKGDTKVFSIAAASIMAKVTRDWIMEEYAVRYPEYLFAQHKGYGTKAHREAISKHGACSIHRKTYKIFRDQY
jgi:ribonuclease HII